MDMSQITDCQLQGIRILIDAFMKNEAISTLDILEMYISSHTYELNVCIDEVNKLL